jgi:hypothetical protein
LYNDIYQRNSNSGQSFSQTREESKLHLTTSFVDEDISLITDCLFLLKKKEKRKEEGSKYFMYDNGRE